MPLSDEEMRLLEQMERALVEEDPKFASTLRGTRFARAARARVIVAGTAFVVGVALLMTGAVLGDRSGIVIGIAGFMVMLASATLGLTAWQNRANTSRPGGDRSGDPRGDDPRFAPGLSVIDGGRSGRKPRRAGKAGKQQRSSQAGFMARMEERWQRRRDQNNGGY